MSFIDFIEIFQSKLKRLHVNKGFYLLILEKIVDSMLNYSKLSSRLYTSMTAFLTLNKKDHVPEQVSAPGHQLGKVNRKKSWEDKFTLTEGGFC